MRRWRGMKKFRKQDFPTKDIRRLLEPGPVVLVSSAYKNETDIMTMGWHMMMEFSPALIGCVISSSNHSFGLIRKSHECVINVPTADMVDTVVRIGNCSGKDGIDKFEHFGLTKGRARKVSAPLIDECYASIECRLYDTALINKYNLFIFKAVKAHVAERPKKPATLHYRGQGVFSTDGPWFRKARLFGKWRDAETF